MMFFPLAISAAERLLSPPRSPISPEANRHRRRCAGFNELRFSDAGETQVGEAFVTPEEVDHFHAVVLARPRGGGRGGENIDGEMDLDDYDLLPGGRSPTHFVGRFGMGKVHRGGFDSAGDPGAAAVAFAEVGRAFGIAGDKRLRGGRDEKLSNTRGRRQSRAYKPVHCSAALSARTWPLR